jgi:hypothetical protein
MYTARVDPYPEVIRPLYHHPSTVPRIEDDHLHPAPVFEIPLILFLSRILSFGEGISERISDTAGILL